LTRSINPVPQYTQGGEPIANGKMYFFETGTNTPKTTYADSAETTANTHPVILDAEGRLPNCFYSGLAKQILTDANDVQVFNRDPVGQEIAIAAFDTFAISSTYQIHNIVTASNGTFWKSLINGNVGFNPITDDGTHWQQIDFNEFYAAGVTFSKNDSAISTVNGLTYISGIDSNIGNEPSANLDKWALDRPSLPYVSGKTYDIGEKCIDEIDSREYVAVISNTGNQPSSDTGTNWDPTDGRVSKPTNTSPADTATDVSRTPTLIASTYAINGSTAPHEYSNFKIYSDAGLTSLVYDSGITSDLESHVVGEQLGAGTQYWWCASYKGIRTNVSDASTATSFTTTLNLSESFDNLTFTGTGATQSITATPDLSTNTGAVFIANTSTTDSMRVVDTVRGVGNAYLVPSIISTAEATGVTAFNFNGYDVGAAAAYNGSGNTIWSLVLKKTAKFFDIVNYTGNATPRVIAHSLNNEVGFIVVFQETGAAPVASPSLFCWFKGMAGSDYFRFGSISASGSLSSVWNNATPTTTEFSLGTSDNVNGTVRDYTAYLLAHNPAAGVYCDTFVTTGTATDKITTGKAGATVFLKQDAADEWIVMDKQLGTSSQIDFDSQAQLVAGNNISSWDSDGVTLSNLSAGTWSVVVIADPDL